MTLSMIIIEDTIWRGRRKIEQDLKLVPMWIIS